MFFCFINKMNTFSTYNKRTLSPSSKSVFMSNTGKNNYLLTSPDNKRMQNNANSFYKSPSKFPETTTNKSLNSKIVIYY